MLEVAVDVVEDRGLVGLGERVGVDPREVVAAERAPVDGEVAQEVDLLERRAQVDRAALEARTRRAASAVLADEERREAHEPDDLGRAVDVRARSRRRRTATGRGRGASTRRTDASVARRSPPRARSSRRRARRGSPSSPRRSARLGLGLEVVEHLEQLSASRVPLRPPRRRRPRRPRARGRRSSGCVRRVAASSRRAAAPNDVEYRRDHHRRARLGGRVVARRAASGSCRLIAARSAAALREVAELDAQRVGQFGRVELESRERHVLLGEPLRGRRARRSRAAPRAAPSAPVVVELGSPSRAEIAGQASVVAACAMSAVCLPSRRSAAADLPVTLGVAEHAEHVVGDLERDADEPTEPRERVDRLRRRRRRARRPPRAAPRTSTRRSSARASPAPTRCSGDVAAEPACDDVGELARRRDEHGAVEDVEELGAALGARPAASRSRGARGSGRGRPRARRPSRPTPRSPARRRRARGPARRTGRRCSARRAGRVSRSITSSWMRNAVCSSSKASATRAGERPVGAAEPAVRGDQTRRGRTRLPPALCCSSDSHSAA